MIIDQHCKGITDVIVQVPEDSKQEQKIETSTNEPGSIEVATKKSKRFSFSRSSNKSSREGGCKSGKNSVDKPPTQKSSVKSKLPSDSSHKLGSGNARSASYDDVTHPLAMVPIEFELHDFSGGLETVDADRHLPNIVQKQDWTYCLKSTESKMKLVSITANLRPTHFLTFNLQ